MTPVVFKTEFVQKYVISRNVYLTNKKVDRLIEPSVLQNAIQKFEYVRNIVNSNNTKEFDEVLTLSGDLNNIDKKKFLL